MLDPNKKKEEFIKQLSIYRWLNPSLNIDDMAEILIWYTDWSKIDAMRKKNQGYPQSRIGNIKIVLWSLEETEIYIASQLTLLDKAILSYETKGITGTRCSDEELWRKEDIFKYYKNPLKTERSTKNYEEYGDAHAHLMKDGNVGKVIEVKGEIVRCKYCSVTQFCPDYLSYKTMGLIKD